MIFSGFSFQCPVGASTKKKLMGDWKIPPTPQNKNINCFMRKEFDLALSKTIFKKSKHSEIIKYLQTDNLPII